MTTQLNSFPSAKVLLEVTKIFSALSKLFHQKLTELTCTGLQCKSFAWLSSLYSCLDGGEASTNCVNKCKPL